MKKLTGNGLWESSRMMLFEHRDAIIEKQSQRRHKVRPVLDEQWAAYMMEKLSEAYQQEQPVQMRIFGTIQDEMMIGTISRINPITGRIQVDDRWIAVSEIMEITEP